MIAVAALAFWDLSDVVVASDCFRDIGTVAGDEIVEGGAAAAEAPSWQEDFAVVRVRHLPVPCHKKRNHLQQFFCGSSGPSLDLGVSDLRNHLQWARLL